MNICYKTKKLLWKNFLGQMFQIKELKNTEDASRAHCVESV